MEASGNLRLDDEKSDQEEDACKDSEEDQLRRSGRGRNPMDKMLSFQREEAHKKEKRLTHLYEQWKIQARNAREQLKLDIPENQLAALKDTLEKGKDDLTNVYVEIRYHLTPSSERRRIDACEAVTQDIVKIAYEAIAGIDGDFDSEAVKQRLRELLNRDYARSIYSSRASPSSQHSSSNHGQPSVCSTVAAKRIDAAAELAAKEAEYEVLLEEERQTERIQLLEEQQKRELEAQKHELKRLNVEKDIKGTRARYIIDHNMTCSKTAVAGMRTCVQLKIQFKIQ